MYETIELYQGHSISIILNKVDVDEDTSVETPVDWEGTHTFIIYRDPAHLKPVMTFTQASGRVTKRGNEMLVTCDKTENILTPDEYFFSIHNDLDEETSFEEGEGKILVRASRKII